MKLNNFRLPGKLGRLGILGKLILFFAALTVVLVLAVGYFTYTLNYRQVASQYSELIQGCVQTAADSVSGDSIARYLSEGRDEEYDRTYARLQDIKRNYGLQYLYVLVPFTDENNTVYIFDTALEGDDMSLIMELGTESGEADVYDILIALYLTGECEDNVAITSGEFGYLASAYLPVYDSAGNIVAVAGGDMEMGDILGEVRSNTVQVLSVTVGIMLLLVVLMLIYVSRSMVRPIKQLSLHMENFVSRSGESLTDTEVHFKSHDELSNMAESFNAMADDIRGYAENLAAVTADRERIATELNLATEIQASMLPSIFPPFPNRHEFNITATMRPAKEVGGDFYDFFMIDERTLGFVVADVSGKGVPAALFMVIAKTLIKDQAVTGTEPGEVFTIVNQQLSEANSSGLFLTAFLGELELDTGRLRYVNAGHNPPVLYRHGVGCQWLRTDPGFVLAGLDDFEYETAELTLAAGDRLFLYTDGVTEATNRELELFGEERLFAALNRVEMFKAPIGLVIETMQRRLQDFVDGAEQADDITMLLVSFESYMHIELEKDMFYTREDAARFAAQQKAAQQRERLLSGTARRARVSARTGAVTSALPERKPKK